MVAARIIRRTHDSGSNGGGPDWSQLTREIEPQIHPMHPDMAAGYGAFTHCIINMLGIFVGIATFFFTKALFQPATDRVTFQPVYNWGIIVSTILYLIVGFFLFLYIPTGAARRAIRQAKRKQLKTLAEEYNAEQQELLEMVQPRALGIPDAQTVQSMKMQIERLKLLNEAINLVENVPSSPINRKTVQRFGLSYLSIYLSTLVYNFLTRAPRLECRTDNLELPMIESMPRWPSSFDKQSKLSANVRSLPRENRLGGFGISSILLFLC